MKNSIKRVPMSRLRSEVMALRNNLSKRHALRQPNLPPVYPPIDTFPDMRLPSSAFNRTVSYAPEPKTSSQLGVPLNFADHLVRIEQCQDRYRDSLKQMLGATYAACIAYDDKSETVKAANKAALEAKCAALKIEGKSYYQLIVKLAFGKESKRASGFVHVVKAARNQKPSVEPDDFITWLTSQGGIQQVRKNLNSDGSEKTQTARSPADINAEHISKAKNSVLNECVKKFQYGELPAIAELGNEGDGLAILQQQADGSVVIKLVLNDSKMVESIYAAHGRKLQ